MFENYINNTNVFYYIYTVLKRFQEQQSVANTKAQKDTGL